MQVRSLGWEDPLEQEMATQSSILAWEIPWTEEPGGLQFMGSVPTGSPFFPTVSYSFQSRCLQRSSGRWAAVLSHWGYGEGQMEYGNLRGCPSTVLLLFKKFGPTGLLKYSANGGLWRNGQIRVLNDLIFLLVTVLSRLKAVFFY